VRYDPCVKGLNSTLITTVMTSRYYLNSTRITAVMTSRYYFSTYCRYWLKQWTSAVNFSDKEETCQALPLGVLA